MSTPAVAAQRRFGTGPLSRAAALVYTLLVVEVLFTVAVLPGLVPLLLLDRDASNLPLVALCAVPFGPALSAALYAVRQHRGDLTDLQPAPAFVRGYRLNAIGALKVWVPLVAWLALIGVNLTHLGAAGVPRWWAVPLVLVGLGAAVAGATALLITSLFVFRLRDVARLSVHFGLRNLATPALLVVATGVTVLADEVVLVLLASVLAMLWLRSTRAMTDAIRDEYTA
jgi:uncharacterized membrane protein YesL